MSTVRTAPGPLLRDWRQRRRFSQLDLAVRAEVSAKHLSYVETGRSRPSPEMIVHLCEHLDVPLHERNQILLAAGHAPRYRDRAGGHSFDPELRSVIETIINAHDAPAIVVDRHWDLVTFNAAAALLLEGIEATMLHPPVNVVRLSLHADGLASRIVNFDEYASHMLQRVRRIAAHTPSSTLAAIIADFGHLTDGVSPPCTGPAEALVVPLVFRTDQGELRFFSTIATFGSPLDATLDDLAIETFYPADTTTRERVRQLQAATTVPPIQPIAN